MGIVQYTIPFLLYNNYMDSYKLQKQIEKFCISFNAKYKTHYMISPDLVICTNKKDYNNQDEFHIYLSVSYNREKPVIKDFFATEAEFLENFKIIEEKIKEAINFVKPE